MQGANPFSYPAPGISSNDIGSGITPSTAFAASGSRSSRPPQQYGQDLKNKKRKIDRACDACRRKKTKCDGPKLPNNVCTNCIQNSRTCTYVEGSRPRGPPKAYVTGLEDRLEKMEALLKRLRPESDFSDVLGPAVIRGSWKSADEQSPPSRSTSLQAISLSPPTTSPLTQAGSYASCVPALSAQTSYRPAQILPDDQSSSWSSLSSPRPAPSALGLSTHLIFKSPAHPKRTRLKLSSSTKTRTPLTAQNESSASSSPSSSPSSSDTDELVESFSGGMQRLTLRGIGSATGEDAGQTRFHGKSSSMTLIQATRAFKEQHMLSMNRGAGGGEDVQMRSRGLREDNTIGDTGGRQTKVVGHSMRRQEYWRTPQWELVWEGLHVNSPELVPSVLTQFPPPDLCAKLIELYFTHTNTQFPLLHKPTFDRQCSEPEPLYKKDVWFAAVCLGVFAVASRWCDDERVLPDAERGRAGGVVDWTTAGWRYFNVVVAIHRMRRSLIHPACLCEVQTFTLMGMFLRGTASHPVGWFIVGVGIRKAQDVGAHRKNVYNNKPSVDEELWKRAWWCLVAFDRVGSTSLGRPCGVGEEDFDVDLPLAVDDEYWETEDPAMAFRQPPGKPDLVTAFNLWVRLTQICAFAVRTIYAVDKSKVLGRIATEWPEEVRAQLNTAMTEWLDGVPEHLKWSNNMENRVFANQSATIYTAYYLTQILIHRPFIRPPSHPLPNDGLQGHAYTTDETSCPALDVCTNAAKSCARIVEKQLQRGLSNIPNLISVAHICAAILLVNVWNLKAEEKAKSAEDVKPPLAQTIEVLMNDVYIFMRALEGVGSRWESGTVYLQKLRDSLPNSDDDSASASVQPTSNFDHAHQPTGVDRTSVPEPSVLDPISMASSHLFPLETPSSRHRSQSQDTDDWRGQSDFLQLHTSYVGPLNTQSRHRPPHQTDPNSSIALKQEFSQRPSYPDGRRNMYNHIRQPHVSFSSHENSNWPPLSQSSSSQPSHSDRSRIRPSSVSSIPRFFSTELPPPSISAMRRTSFSGRNQDGERGGQSYERYSKHGEMSNTRSLVKPENTNLNYGDEVDGRSVYYRPPPDVAIRSQLQPQSPWDKNSYRTSDWGNHQHAAPTVEHSNDLVTWSARTTDRYPQTTSDIRGVQLDRDPHDAPYSEVYST